MTPAVGIVADDLTGANDAAAQFACRGWATLLSLRPGDGADPLGNPEVVAVSTDSRGRRDAALRLVRGSVAALARTGVEHLYLKIDSTLRGPVTEQVAGALDGWVSRHPDAFAVVCPAYPAMGRVVRRGYVWADGMPLEESPAGRDPVTPVSTSALVDLVRESVHVPPGPDAAGSARMLLDAAAHHRVLTVDAATDADLAMVAAAVAVVGPRAVPVGSAGLAAALADVWRPPGRGRGSPPADHRRAAPAASRGRGPVILVTSSLHDIARAQSRRVEAAHRGRAWVLAPEPDDLADDRALASWRSRQRPPADPPDVVLVTAPLPAAPVAPRAPRQVAARLAAVVDDVRSRLGAACLVVTGGDGAGALLDLWGCAGIAVAGAVLEGVPHGVLVGGRADGLPVITKAGGFGNADTMVDAVAWAIARGREPASRPADSPTAVHAPGRE